MKQLKLREGDLYISDDTYNMYSEFWKDQETESNVRVLFSLFLNHLLRERLGEYIKNYGRLNGLDKYALLATQSVDANKGAYKDGNRLRSIQTWTEEQDGKYSTLFLPSDNIKTPKSKKSILFVPNVDVVRAKEASLSDVFWYKLIVPGVGEVNPYNLESELEKLLKSNGREE